VPNRNLFSAGEKFAEGSNSGRVAPETLKVSAVNELQQRIFSLKDEEAPTDRLDRRREPRVQVDRLVYVQPVDAENGYFEEVRSMRDLSRSGFYFTTERVSYLPGLQLHVVPAFGCLNLEYLGEVVRVEQLPFGEFGVAVRLIRVEKMVPAARSSTMARFEALARADSLPVVLPESDSDSSL
jgi:PilZ domain